MSGTDKQGNESSHTTQFGKRICQLSEKKVITCAKRHGDFDVKGFIEFIFDLDESKYEKVVDKNNVKLEPQTNIKLLTHLKVIPKNGITFFANRGLPADKEHITSM